MRDSAARRAARKLLRRVWIDRDEGLEALDALERERRARDEQRQTPKTKPRTVIYFLQMASGPIKIGVTEHFRDRWKAIGVCNPEILTPLLVIHGTRDDERALHRAFSDLRINGEWFRPEPPLLAYIEYQRPGLPVQ